MLTSVSNVAYVFNGIMTCHFFFILMMWYFLLKNYKNVFTSKKKNLTSSNSSKTHDSDIEPFQARQRAQYRSWRRWRRRRRRWEWLQCSQQSNNIVVFGGRSRRSFRRGGVVGSHFDFRQSRGAEVCWWWWPQWLDSMDRNIVLVLLCFSETFWRLLECQKAYVCIREKAGVQIWRLGHKENEEK